MGQTDDIFLFVPCFFASKSPYALAFMLNNSQYKQVAIVNFI